jgi:hypothetical protein
MLELYEITVTSGAMAKVHPDVYTAALLQHAGGNYGLLTDKEDLMTNKRCAERGNGGMVMSIWLIDPTSDGEAPNDTVWVHTEPRDRFWILTDQVAKVTTVLLPEEY